MAVAVKHTNSPQVILCSGSGSQWLHLFPGEAIVSAIQLYKPRQAASSEAVPLALGSCRHDLLVQGQCSQRGRTLYGDIGRPGFGP